MKAPNVDAKPEIKVTISQKNCIDTIVTKSKLKKKKKSYPL